MPQYLISGYLPENFNPATMDPSAGEKIHEMNREQVALGIRKFACGLGKSRTIRPQPSGEAVITDGPYLEAKEIVGGFSILEVENWDEALKWAKRAHEIMGTPVEVREIFFAPAPPKE